MTDSMTLSKQDSGSSRGATSSMKQETTFELNLAERGTYFQQVTAGGKDVLSAKEVSALSALDLIYRTLCAVMFNHSSSGHPGGSVSCGRIVESLLYQNMRYNFSDPNDKTSDYLIFTAGHKALGMYAMWACRNEIMRVAHPELLPDVLQQMRLEDLLGFRKNPTITTPLFTKFHCKALDGHPTPQTPFVWLSTGPSGVGVTASVGMSLALKDLYGDSAPYVHIVEGEGGMTPGRVSEALASAASSGLNNFVMHVDWNQAAIDSNSVTRDGSSAGDYVQWDPRELLLTQGFNVIYVADGFDFQQVTAAQQLALEQSRNSQSPSAIVYRTTKGWRYGVEGKKSHGGGHKFYSDEYLQALEPFEKEFGLSFPRFEGEKTAETREQAFYDSLLVIRQAFESQSENTSALGEFLMKRNQAHQSSLPKSGRGMPDLALFYDNDNLSPEKRPEICSYKNGSQQTLRGALAHALNSINHTTKGALLAASADVYGSTNTTNIGDGFGEGFWHAQKNPQSRILSAGGICEDAIGGICSGISTIGQHIGIGSSYGAFMVPLTVISARTHSIAQQTIRHRNPDEQFKTFIVLCGHTGIKTGEDGPTHAEPNTLQMFQENYPRGTMITLTPWDPNELWPLTVTALKARPAVMAPFVTRPNETVFDRAALGLAPAEASVKGVYKLYACDGEAQASIVYQGSDVANVFVSGVLPKLKERGLKVDVYYIASVELFDRLDSTERAEIYSATTAGSAMMISGFTLPTTYRWVTSPKGREATLYPHKHGEYLGSGTGEMCIEEAGLDARAQLTAIEGFVRGIMIAKVWKRIVQFQGKEFYTKTKLPFTYEVVNTGTSETIIPSRTDWSIPKRDFEKALALVPIDGPGRINSMVQGPAYTWGILHDDRVRQGLY